MVRPIDLVTFGETALLSLLCQLRPGNSYTGSPSPETLEGTEWPAVLEEQERYSDMRFSVGLVLVAIGGAIIGAVAMYLYSEVSRGPEPIVKQSGILTPAPTEIAEPSATPTSAPEFASTPTAVRTPASRVASDSPTLPQIPFPSPVAQRTFGPDESQVALSNRKLDELPNAYLLPQINRDLFNTIARLPWIMDGLSNMESEPAQSLVRLALEYPEAADEMLRMYWMTDELDEDEAWTVGTLAYLAFDAPETFRRIAALPWVTDGIHADESWALGALSDIAMDAPHAAQQIASYPWFNDGLDTDEVTAVTALGSIAYETGGGTELVGMSFLDSIEPSDAFALMSLEFLAYESPIAFRRVMAHTSVTDGITDDETPVLALLQDVHMTNPDMVDTLLDQSNVQIERRSIELPFAGDVELTIARLQPGAPRSMELLETTVRFTEGFMGEPFPTNFVLLFYADAVLPDAAGHNSGFNMTVHPDFDSDDDSDDAHFAPFILTHEVAHYYWHSSSQLWLDEGAAEVMSIIYEESTTGQEAQGAANTFPCGYGADLSGVERLEDALAEDCAYSIGTRFFLDLYRTLGEEEFQRGFRDLYRMGADIFDPEDPDARGITHVREAFGFSQEARDDIIPKWYWESP